MLHRPPSPNARRQRKRQMAEANRSRVARATERRDRGVACYQVEIGADVLDMLVRLQWLADDAVTDRKQVEAALSAILADTAKR